ncbi:MAG: DsbE family thiol:disulfide interchange protein [Rhodospirillales bacterium]|nr:DsbE family thiol:disulfide interchange protein [Rhodospirillales bacterium]
MKRFVYFLPLLVFVVLGAYFAVGLQKDPRELPSMLIDRKVPEFSMPALEGFERGFASTDLKGRVSLVNIFGSWCVACLQEHPFLMELKQQNAIPIYGIDWREKERSAGPAWLRRHGNPYTLVGDDPDSRVSIDFGVTGAPETFIVDKEGVVRYKHVGPVTARVWQETLLPIVEELRSR